MSPRKRTVSLEEKKWFKTTHAILGMAVAAIAVISGLAAAWKHLGWSGPTNPYEYVEIVVDASEGMREPFFGKTKQEAISAALEVALSSQSSDPDKLALRQYSGECHGDNNTRLLVNFHRNNRGEIRNAVRALKLQGQAPLASAVVKATGDFPMNGDAPRRIIVIAGDAGCDANAPNYISERLNAGDKKIKLDFHFIYLGQSAEQFEKLKEIAKGTGGDAIPADTPDRLKAALVRTIEIAPVLSDIRASGEILDGVVNQTNRSLEALQRKDYSAAQESLKAAHGEFDHTELLFQDFRKRQSRDLFRDAQQLASQNRDIQSRILALTQQMIDEQKRNDLEAYDKSLQDFRSVREMYNANAQKLDDIAAKLTRQ